MEELAFKNEKYPQGMNVTNDAIWFGSEKSRLRTDTRVLLTSKTIEGPPLAFQSVHHVHSSDCFTFRVLSVGNRVTNNILQKNFEHTSRFLIDQAGNSLDSTTACQSANGRFCDPLDVVTQNLSVTFRPTFSQSFASLTASRHFFLIQRKRNVEYK